MFTIKQVKALFNVGSKSRITFDTNEYITNGFVFLTQEVCAFKINEQSVCKFDAIENIRKYSFADVKEKLLPHKGENFLPYAPTKLIMPVYNTANIRSRKVSYYCDIYENKKGEQEAINQAYIRLLPKIIFWTDRRNGLLMDEKQTFGIMPVKVVQEDIESFDHSLVAKMQNKVRA